MNLPPFDTGHHPRRQMTVWGCEGLVRLRETTINYTDIESLIISFVNVWAQLDTQSPFFIFVSLSLALPWNRNKSLEHLWTEFMEELRKKTWNENSFYNSQNLFICSCSCSRMDQDQVQPSRVLICLFQSLVCWPKRVPAIMTPMIANWWRIIRCLCCLGHDPRDRRIWCSLVSHNQTSNSHNNTKSRRNENTNYAFNWFIICELESPRDPRREEFQCVWESQK